MATTKPPGLIATDPKNLISDFQRIMRTEPGAVRRQMILELLIKPDRYMPGKIAVNKKRCFNLNKDSDLQWMLARGWLERSRDIGYGNKSKVTYLTITTLGKKMYKKRR